MLDFGRVVVRITPLRGLVRRADMSHRDWSTAWISPQSGYVPKGKVFQQKSLAFLQGFAPQPGLEPGTP